MRGTKDEVRTEDRSVDGRHGPLPVRLYRGTGPERASLVWVHGGAFSGGSLEQRESDAVARALARRGYVVLTVDYRLAPRWGFRGPVRLAPSANRYPVPVDDVVDAFRDFAERQQDVPLLGGASAGACLAVSAAQSLRDSGALPKKLLLAYGTYHAALPPIPDEVRARTRGCTASSSSGRTPSTG
ncbi:alpha/beta hydrolase fold domain-containing protein [Curtobacterium sp. ISL-83]|uniref:alpha/beta hydrolase n=1 Tax=Curtobacterium sp. ISL-83 TaxID=2819145 RepID=UPI001BEB992F|nr:alpha/beta hydrolase fold domain-containing protein [Curtobacterium sp. ISL-83]